MLLVVCLLMTDQSTSLFMEAVSAAAWQPEEEETFQSGNGETSEEIQEGGEEQEQDNSGQIQDQEQDQIQQTGEQQPAGDQMGEEQTPAVQNEDLTVSISAANSSAAYGDQVILNGTVSDPSATLQWQYSADNGGSWQDISGANGTSYSPEHDFCPGGRGDRKSVV